LVVKSAASHHAISVPFEKTLKVEEEFKKGGEALVVQYEVKLQKGLDCGGAYIKLLSEDAKGIQAQVSFGREEDERQ
jgi:calnexin